MAEFSKIAWTTHTFNPWIGCSHVSPGCVNCYAEGWDRRYRGGENWGPGAPRQVTSDANWAKPLAWNKSAPKGERQRVFCASLADVFDLEAPAGQRERLFDLIRATPNLDWLLLTKRPQNVTAMLPLDWGTGYANVWMGVTTEDQKRADERIPILASIPAVVRFLSVEPQIEEIDFGKWLSGESAPPFNWMIFGGESGPGARPFDPEWIRKPLELGHAWRFSPPRPWPRVRFAIFVKQMGLVWAKEHGSSDDKGGNWDEWPSWARVRIFPTILVDK
jgi:protein gp37